jgi:hypothetical protein
VWPHWKPAGTGTFFLLAIPSSRRRTLPPLSLNLARSQGRQKTHDHLVASEALGTLFKNTIQSKLMPTLLIFLQPPVNLFHVCSLPQNTFHFYSCKRRFAKPIKIHDREINMATCKGFSLEIVFPPPCFSRKRRAFSKKEGLPSISSSASRIGLPVTNDFIGLFSLPAERKVGKGIIESSKLRKIKETNLDTNNLE